MGAEILDFLFYKDNKDLEGATELDIQIKGKFSSKEILAALIDNGLITDANKLSLKHLVKESVREEVSKLVAQQLNQESIPIEVKSQKKQLPFADKKTEEPQKIKSSLPITKTEIKKN